MKITVRSKSLSNGMESLYLDIYAPENGRRYKEYLKLYLHARPGCKAEREFNKKTETLAENIRSKRLLDLQNTAHGFQVELKKNGNFIEYFHALAQRKMESPGNHGVWDSVHKHLIKYTGNTLPFSQLTTDWLEGFKRYLSRDAVSRTGQKLSRNSHYSYFNKVVAALNLATKEPFLAENPATFVQRFKEPESQREFLTLEELRKLVKTECDIPVLKQAFLFSALTGLRWSDIHKLTWSEVHFSDAHGWCIRFTQKKTQGAETLPISNQARELMGDQGAGNEPVFSKLKYGTPENLKLSLWITRAGIAKKITFHCARHTYATLQLTFGVDIYTVSKLLGHRNISTTTIYAKVIDQKKIEAANKIPSLL